MRLDATAQEQAFVRATLQRFVPGRVVWAFGSRVTGRARPNSDLDLAILGDTRVPLPTMAALRHAFEESALRFPVDIVEWAAASAGFRRIIEKEHVVLLAGHRR